MLVLNSLCDAAVAESTTVPYSCIDLPATNYRIFTYSNTVPTKALTAVILTNDEKHDHSRTPGVEAVFFGGPKSPLFKVPKSPVYM